MPLYAAISPDKLSRLIGRPDTPGVIDVRTDEDFAADPRLIPGRAPAAARCRSRDWAPRLPRPVRRRGLPAGPRSSAKAPPRWLRHAGAAAEVLEGGFDAWAAAGLPLVPAATPARRATPDGRTVWVTRARPKIDRIACPWLIRRFVDPARRFLFVAAGRGRSASPSGSAPTPFDIDGDGRVLEPPRRALHLRRDGRGVRPRRLAPLRRLARIVRGADTARLDLAPEAAGLLAASLGLSRMYRRRPGAARGRAAALRRLLPLVPRRGRRDPRLAARARAAADVVTDARSRRPRGPARRPLRRGARGLGAGRGAQLRRPGRADRA